VRGLIDLGDRLNGAAALADELVTTLEGEEAGGASCVCGAAARIYPASDLFFLIFFFFCISFFLRLARG
jgi:hypothetical protein